MFLLWLTVHWSALNGQRSSRYCGLLCTDIVEGRVPQVSSFGVYLLIKISTVKLCSQVRILAFFSVCLYTGTVQDALPRCLVTGDPFGNSCQCELQHTVLCPFKRSKPRCCSSWNFVNLSSNIGAFTPDFMLDLNSSRFHPILQM